ncbi:F-box/kelch-repeat protein [Iris pallida]|uniref:F-box/kelch-repeat protein n=1 Tax=Iris pallida TaxID=29817 RepID=A0AAX6HS30_IRIPA|nr:F-box/kelch-repeat protein [Iris pallida]
MDQAVEDAAAHHALVASAPAEQDLVDGGGPRSGLRVVDVDGEVPLEGIGRGSPLLGLRHGDGVPVGGRAVDGHGEGAVVGGPRAGGLGDPPAVPGDRVADEDEAPGVAVHEADQSAGGGGEPAALLDAGEGEAVPLPEGGVVGVAGGVVVGREHEVPRLLRRRPGGPEEAPRADDAVPPPAHGRRAQRARHGQEGEDAFRNVVGEDAVDRYRAAGIVGVDAGVGRGVGVPRRGAAANEGDGSVIHR